ncbi:hypothetical protein H1C71_026511, partial [Ictidomys tridecemlineatus]
MVLLTRNFGLTAIEHRGISALGKNRVIGEKDAPWNDSVPCDLLPFSGPPAVGPRPLRKVLSKSESRRFSFNPRCLPDLWRTNHPWDPSPRPARNKLGDLRPPPLHPGPPRGSDRPAPGGSSPPRASRTSD